MELSDKSLPNFVLAVVIIGITLVIGVFISASIQTGIRDTFTPGTTINETITAVSNTTASTLTFSDLTDFSGTTAVCINSSNNELIPSTNYTYSETGTLISTDTLCTGVLGGTSPYYCGWDWKCTYSYTFSADTAGSNASGDLVTALSGGSAWVTILVVVGFAVIVLGFLISGLGKSSAPTGPAY